MVHRCCLQSSMLIEGQMPLLPTMSTDSFFNLVESLPSTTPTDAPDGSQLVSFVQLLSHGLSSSTFSGCSPDLLGRSLVRRCPALPWKTVSCQWLWCSAMLQTVGCPCSTQGARCSGRAAARCASAA